MKTSTKTVVKNAVLLAVGTAFGMTLGLVVSNSNRQRTEEAGKPAAEKFRRDFSDSPPGPCDGKLEGEWVSIQDPGKTFRFIVSGDWGEFHTSSIWPQLDGYKTALTSMGGFYNGRDEYIVVYSDDGSCGVLRNEIELMRNIRAEGLEFQSIILHKKGR